MKGYFFLALLLASCLLYSCPSRTVEQETVDTKVSVAEEASNNKDCDTQAMVQDASGMDGCRFLFILDSGEKLLPNEMPLMDFKLAGNQLVNISYTVIEDGVSACMMENQIVKVNCIEFITQTGGVRPAKKECVKVDNYNESKWLKYIAADMSPHMITRFAYLTDGWAYLIDNGVQKKLIDCQGREVCTLLGKAGGPCYDKIRNLGKGEVIYSKTDVRND
jgi:hypothetical protein